MSTPETKPRLRDRQATQDALIAAAAAVFAEKGYENATTRSIAEAANCSEALIQRYFNGKEGLLLAVLQQNKEPDHTAFLDRPLCSSLVDEAEATFANLTKVFAARAKQMRIVLSRVLLDPGFQAEFNRISVRNQVKIGMEARLARYAEAGLLNSAIDLRSAAEFLMSLAFQLAFMHREIHQSDPTELRRLAADFAIFFGRAVSAPTTKPDGTP